MSFTGVTNPSAPQAFSPAVNGATLNENGLTIGSSTIGNLVAVVPNLGPSQPSIALSGVLASQKDVTMTISLLPEVAIPSTGRLLITLSGQGWKIPENTAAVYSSPASGAVASASLLDSSDSSNVLLVQVSGSTNSTSCIQTCPTAGSALFSLLKKPLIASHQVQLLACCVTKSWGVEAQQTRQSSIHLHVLEGIQQFFLAGFETFIRSNWILRRSRFCDTM
jgi:hypothetical protein